MSGNVRNTSKELRKENFYLITYIFLLYFRCAFTHTARFYSPFYELIDLKTFTYNDIKDP